MVESRASSLNHVFCREPDGPTTEQAPQTGATAQLRARDVCNQARRPLDRPQRIWRIDHQELPVSWLQF
jgi:hypothetical protein